MFVGLFIATNGSCQEEVNVLDYFKKLSNHYSKLERYQLELEVDYFGNDDEVLMKQTGKVVHTKDIHYFKMSGNTVLQRDNEFIAINDQSKMITYNNLKKMEKPIQGSEESTGVSSILDSLWANQDRLKCSIVENSNSLLSVLIKDNGSEYYSSYLMLIDKRTYQLIEYSYYLKQQADESQINHITIKYKKEITNPSINKDWLKTKYYVKYSNSGILPSKIFSDYKIIDQTKNLLENE